MPRTPPPTPAASRLEIDLSAIERNARALMAVVEAGAGARAEGVGPRPRGGDAAGGRATAGPASPPAGPASTPPGPASTPAEHPRTETPKPSAPGPTPSPALCGVVKKNAYGLGAVPIAHRLVKAGCAMLAVYAPDEARALAAGAITAPILLLSPLRELTRDGGLYRPAVAERLHLSIHDPDQLAAVNEIGRTFGIPLPVHLYLDTGMSRSGLSEPEFHEILNTPARLRHLRLAGLYTHLTSADTDPDLTLAQLNRFQAAVDQHADTLPPDVILHLANSYGTLRDRRLHLNMVRPGLGLLGYAHDTLSTDAGPAIEDAPRLEHAVRWVAPINHVQRYPAGATVGYGSTFTLTRDSVLGVVPVGYADGYPLGLSNQGVARVTPPPPEVPPPPGASPEVSESSAIRHQPSAISAPVLGRVNMDQIMIDLTDAAEGLADVAVLRGSEAELIGNDPDAPNALPRLAALARTHCYEMLCRLSPNIPRVYLQ